MKRADADRMVRQAGETLQALPGERVRGYGKAWPDTLVTWGDMLARIAVGGQRGWTPGSGVTRIRPAPPSARAIAELDTVLGWVMHYKATGSETSAFILMARVLGVSHQVIAAALPGRLSRETIRKRYYTILDECRAGLLRKNPKHKVVAKVGKIGASNH